MLPEVRCDEQHPECGRCMRAGVKYPGYDQQLKWSNKYEVFLPNGAEKAVRKTTSATNAKNVKKDNAEVPAMHMPDAPNKSKIPVNPVNSQEHDESLAS
ncbi:unnamed protein product, partial [Clonostachys chloroleuca]